MNSFKLSASVSGSVKSGKANLKVGLLNNGSLEKAMLIPLDPNVPQIEFMFNPTELTFNGEIETNAQSGTQDKKEGTQKVSFSQVKAFSVSISKIVYDTYETGEDVVEKYIDPFKAAVKFIGSIQAKSLAGIKGIPGPLKDKMNEAINKLPSPIEKGISKLLGSKSGTNKSSDYNRPPIYRFVWGEQVYIRTCFVEKLTYKLTMFLPDGTPVRAVIDNLTLKDAGNIKPSDNIQTAVVDRLKDSLEARLNIKGSFKI
jgi:hypothetical protein